MDRKLLSKIYDIMLERHPEWRASVAMERAPKKETTEFAVFVNPTHFNCINEDGKEHCTLRLDWELADDADFADDPEKIVALMILLMEKDLDPDSPPPGIREIIHE